MKIRKGFVSNSSSSSFIMGIVNLGKVKPENTTGLTIIEATRFPKEEWPDYEVESVGDGKLKVSLESFTYSEVSVLAEEGDLIGYFELFRGSDSDFYSDDDPGYPNYDIGLDFFNEEELEIYKRVSAMGGKVDFGAGRNG